MINLRKKPLFLFAFFCFLVTQIYHLDSYTFQIDEMILTEGIEKSFSDYKAINPSFGTSLKVNHWLAEHFLGGGPFSWRLISFFSFSILILGLFYLFKSEVIGVSLILFLLLLHFPSHYASWGVFSYMFPTFLSFAVFFLGFLVITKKQFKISFFLLVFLPTFLLSLIQCFGDAFSSLLLLPIFFVDSFLKKEKKGVFFFLLLGAISCLFLLLFYFNAISPQLHNPRTSIKHLYYPLSQHESFFLYLKAGLLKLLKQSYLLKNSISHITVILSFLAIFSGFSPLEKKNEYKSIFRTLSLWVFLNLVAFSLLGGLGKAPFGDIRYLKILVWTGPLLLYLGALLLFQKLPESSFTDSKKKILFYSFSLLALASVTKDHLLHKKEVFKGHALIEEALKENADLYFSDLLHKFSFAYLSPEKSFQIISRGYPCDHGKYWDAYGWHPCSENRKKPHSEALKVLSNKKNKTLLLIARGRFTKKSYPHWFKAVVEKEGFQIKKLTSYKGDPFVYKLERD